MRLCKLSKHNWKRFLCSLGCSGFSNWSFVELTNANFKLFCEVIASFFSKTPDLRVLCSKMARVGGVRGSKHKNGGRERVLYKKLALYEYFLWAEIQYLKNIYSHQNKSVAHQQLLFEASINGPLRKPCLCSGAITRGLSVSQNFPPK